ncbi:MAG TPA: 3-methyl-2-oxobutanoate hydroxymethyltransferase [Chthoniobacterales bacterium]
MSSLLTPSDFETSPTLSSERLQPSHLKQMKAAGNRIAALTAYDYPTARLLDEAGVDCLLVGDSLGMVVLGYPDTTSVTLQDIVHHTRAAARGVKHALLVADLPIGTYDRPEQALLSALELIEAGAQAVKLEGCHTAHIKKLVSHDIPVMAHLGMLPQQVREEGGYKVKGKTPADADRLVRESLAVEEAGAFAAVLEIVVPAVAHDISRKLAIPTIGIGSGTQCDGQILVTHDLIGFFPWFTPKFVRPAVRIGETIRDAAREFVADVKR